MSSAARTRWNNGWTLLAGPALEVEKLECPLSRSASPRKPWTSLGIRQQRKQFGKRICTHQSIRHMLADVQTKLRLPPDVDTRRWLVRQQPALQRRDFDGQAVRLRDAVEIVLTCQQVMGAYGMRVVRHGAIRPRHACDADLGGSTRHPEEQHRQSHGTAQSLTDADEDSTHDRHPWRHPS